MHPLTTFTGFGLCLHAFLKWRVFFLKINSNLKTNKMKKLFLLLAITIMFASCNKEKCITCTEQTTGVKGSYCGKKSERKAFENKLKTTGESMGQTWTCKESD